MEKIFEFIPVSAGWQKIIGILIIILLTFLAAYIIRITLYFITKKIIKRTKTDLDDRIILGLRKYIYWLVYLFGLTVLFNYVQQEYEEFLGQKIFQIIDGISYSIGVLLVCTVAVKFISAILGWYSTHIAIKTETKLDDEFVPLFDRVIKTILYVLAILIILKHFEVDINGLLTLLGVGSLAIALAAKDTISNMIGGFIIMIDRPFRVGDRIKLEDGAVCTVHQIGVRSTKLLTLDNTYIITPNAELMNSTVHNLTYPFPQIRIVVDVGVSYSTDLKLVRDIMLELASKHDKVVKNPAPEFVFLNFGDSSLDVSLRCRVAEIEDYYITQSQLREQILERFRHEDIEIPFPQRVVTHVNPKQD